MRWSIAAALVLLGACGSEPVGRAFELEVRGLSARASALVVKLRSAEPALACSDVTLESAAALAADETQRWDRSSGGERSLAMSPVVTDRVTLVAYAIDDAGATFQVACRTVSYEELGNLAGGRLILVLSRRAMAAL